MARKLGIEVPTERIAAFCRRWKVTEFALFGSVLRDDFGPDSDIDVLVELAPNHGLGLFDWVDMIDELRACSDVRLISSPSAVCETPSAATEYSPRAR